MRVIHIENIWLKIGRGRTVPGVFRFVQPLDKSPDGRKVFSLTTKQHNNGYLNLELNIAYRAEASLNDSN